MQFIRLFLPFRAGILLFPLFFSLASFGQIQKPVNWEFSYDNEVLVLKAKFPKGWHLYSQKDYGDEGPVPTSFEFTPSADYEKDGATQEGKSMVKHMDKTWGFEIEYYEKEAEFTQKIKSKISTPYTISGKLNFMVCNDSMCLPPEEVDFQIKVDPSKKKSAGTDSSDQSFISIFIFGFFGGFAALLTPCVFPMIPLTVSFFTKRSKTRAKGISNAITYGLAIIFIYVTLGLAVTMIFGPDALNAFSTNVWFNLALFALLVVFAISFLGAFEIVLPSAFVNKIDAQSERGGLIGIFFMAFTLSLVSFSCTSGIIGPLLVEAAVHGGIKGPFWGMFGFAVALALPFGLFAVFPGWLNSLPKSGGWLNSVKVVLGFLELALAFKFASNADLVVQAGILTREVFIALWIVIFGLMGIYLLGWIKLPHDSELKHVSVGRLFMAILTLSFVVYLIPGMWGAPLKIISGFPPPDFYAESPMGLSTGGGKSGDGSHGESDRVAHCPNNLPCYHDYDEALAAARASGKPLMIDFTGWACVNCRKMESEVWTDPEVDKRLRNDVILVSLYVDDKKQLPDSQKTVKKLGDRDFKINTIGNKWSYFQASKYGTNAQPQYILLDHKEEMLSSPTDYDPDIQKYIKWLDDGIAEFKKRSAAAAAPDTSASAKAGEGTH